MKIRDIRKTHKKLIGRISTLKRMMDKRKERIINYKRDIWEFQKELDIRQKQLKKVVGLWDIKPSFKRKRRGKYYYWIGFVKFLKKNPKEFQIGTDEIYNKESKTYWIKNVRNRFIKHLTETQLEGYVRGGKSKFH